MRIPPTVKSGGVEYTVVLCNDLDDKLGQVDFIKQEIQLDSGLRGDMLMQIFCHELMHTVNNEFDHEIIEFLGQSFFRLLKENNFYG